MGISFGKNEEPESQLLTMLHQYRVVKEKSNDHVTVLENCYNTSLIVELRHLKFSGDEQFQQKLRSLEKVKTISHPCILKIIGIHHEKLDQFCSTFHQISVVTERPISTLFQNLQQRGQSDFSESELWFLLDCIVSAQAQFQKLLRQTKSLTFSDIISCPVIQQQTGVGQIWKLAPIELDFDGHSYVSVYERFRMNMGNLSEDQMEYHLYPSPEEIQQLKAKAKEPNVDFAKSSVFTLGMLLLHLAQGEACDFIYDMDQLELIQELLKERLQEIQEKYSQSFCDTMNNMLIYECDNRPDYVSLDRELNNIPSLQGKRIQDRAAAYQGPVMVHGNQQSKAILKSNQNKSNYQSQNKPSNNNSRVNEQAAQSSQFAALPYYSTQQYENTLQHNYNQQYGGQEGLGMFSRQSQPQFQQSYQPPYQQSFLPPSQAQSQFTSANNHYDQVMVTESYLNGSRYTGDKINGLRHGKGRMDFTEGGFYEGQWKDNTMCGKGQLYYDNGQKAYDGEFKDGKFHNFGHLWNKQPLKQEQPFDYKNFKQLGDLWLKYEGDFQDDKKHGYGVLQLTNGEKYNGSFKDDYVQGYGAYTKSNGQTINGYWEYSILSRLV